MSFLWKLWPNLIIQRNYFEEKTTQINYSLLENENFSYIKYEDSLCILREGRDEICVHQNQCTLPISLENVWNTQMSTYSNPMNHGRFHFRQEHVSLIK